MTSRMLAVVGIACIFGAAFPTSPENAIPVLVRHAPIRIHRQRNLTKWDSTNWSGYAVTGPNMSVSDVKGSWIVPAARCTGSSAEASDAYASFWVGIDGWTSNTVEQIGTDSDCVSVAGKDNVPTYYAWFEFFPRPAFYIGNPGNGFHGFVVEPGDVMSAEVKALGSQFTLMISDTRSGVKQWTYVTNSFAAGAQRSSAEWIVETPCCQRNRAFLPLTNFGVEHFGDWFTDVGNTSFATVRGQTGPIGSFGNNVQEITMVSEGAPGGSPIGALMTQPSILAAGGTSFSVNWQNWGP